MQNTLNQKSLGQRTSQGFSWVLLQTFAVKFVNVIGQIVLAYFLTPNDLGKVGLAFTAVAFIGSLQQTGMREILVQRGKKIEYWANTGFWISVCSGIIGAFIIALCAPVLSKIYKTPSLAQMIWILSLSLFISNLGIVPLALMQSRFQFRTLSIISAIVEASQMTITLILAYCGFGAFSFIWSALIATSLRIVLMWRASKPQIRYYRPMRHWQYLSGNLVSLAASGALTALIWQGDYIVLGIFTSSALVGIYFMGFTIAQQTIYIFIYNMSPILLSSMSHLQADSKKQQQVFLRTSELLAFVGIPLCLLQAVLAEIFLRLFYAERWQSAAIVVSILSIGMIGRVLEPASDALIKAKGSYKTTLILAACHAFSLIASLTLIAHTQNLLWISVTVAFWLLTFGLVRAYCALQLSGGRWIDLLSLVLRPCLMSVVTIGLGWILCRHLINQTSHLIALVGVAFLVVFSVALYILLGTRFMATTWQDLMSGLRYAGVTRYFDRLKRN